MPQTRRLAAAVIAAVMASVTAASAVAAAPLAPSERCAVAAPAVAHPPLPHVARLVTEGREVRIVALGSSSTSGTGATSAAATYPAQLAAILAAGRPAVSVHMVNSGIGGETVALNMARLHRDVLEHAPDLVIWQLATNDVFRKVPRDTYLDQARDGIRQIQAAGADVVLMEPQYVPARAADAPYVESVAAVRALGVEFSLPVITRFDFMKAWLDDGRFTVEDMLSTDGLHMTDASYRCLAEVVAGVIAPPAVTAAKAATGG